MPEHDDALHDEREEQAAIRWSEEPRGRRINGVWSENAPSRGDAEADRV